MRGLWEIKQFAYGSPGGFGKILRHRDTPFRSKTGCSRIKNAHRTSPVIYCTDTDYIFIFNTINKLKIFKGKARQ